MGKVTNLTVEYGRTVQPKDYESKTAKAIIGVAFADDEHIDTDTELEAAFDYAVKHVHNTLGLGGSTLVKTKPAPAKKPETKAEPKEDPAAIVDDTPPAKPAAKKAQKADPAAVEDEGEEDFLNIGDEVSDDEKTREIPDGELNLAIGKKVKELQASGVADASNQIKEIIASFSPDRSKPFTARELTQAQRPKFLAKLNALKG